MLDEYIKELELDLKIDELNLKDYQLRLPALKHKWSGRLIRLRMDVLQSSKTLTELKSQLALKIQKEAIAKLSNQSITHAIETHPDFLHARQEIEEKKLVIELLEKTEKTLSSITFDVKNLIEIMKLETT